MEIDGELLASLQEPTLHFYDWKGDSLTYGYFIRLEKFLNLNALDRLQIGYARRPTGGGITFHLWDFAFSFLLPATSFYFSLNPLENYRFVNCIVLNGIKNYFGLKNIELVSFKGKGACHFCMEKPTEYDVVYQGLKIAGAAQRLKKQGYLHQGSISLVPPEEKILSQVLLSNEVLSKIQTYSFAPVASPLQLQGTRRGIKEMLIQEFRKIISCDTLYSSL